MKRQTSILSRAVDGLSDPEMRKAVTADLLKYLDTDTVWSVAARLLDNMSVADRRPALCSFHEEFPEQLVKLQEAHWKGLIDWVRKTYDVEIQIYEGILNTRQSDATILKLGAVVAKYDQFKLAGEQC